MKCTKCGDEYDAGIDEAILSTIDKVAAKGECRFCTLGTSEKPNISETELNKRAFAIGQQLIEWSKEGENGKRSIEECTMMLSHLNTIARAVAGSTLADIKTEGPKPAAGEIGSESLAGMLSSTMGALILNSSANVALCNECIRGFYEVHEWEKKHGRKPDEKKDQSIH